jgi:hypothetical protein
MMKSAAASCSVNRPCRHYDPCARCSAERYLLQSDWELLEFYNIVQDQVDGVSGAPRLEGYEAAARLHGYPPSRVPWLVAGAALINRLISKTDVVDWQRECGKPLRLIGPEDVS